jgi:tetratricopeptide (TPR) repeat protein
MKINRVQLACVARRLREATGFVELGLPQYALDRLDGLGDPGPFAAQVEFVRGEALRRQHRYSDAAASLKRAAEKFPAPYNKPVMLALSDCYRQVGDNLRAINALGFARGAGPRPSGHLPRGGPA